MIYTLTLNPAVDRELTVSELTFDSVLRATQSQVDFGGKGFNVSRLLKNLGADSTAVGFLGGKAGEILQIGLQALDIATDFVWVSGETRTNISIISSPGGHYIKVNEKGPAIRSGEQQALLDKIENLARPGDWWVLAGSLPPGIPDDFYAQVIQKLSRCGALSLLDTIGEPLRLGCREKPFLVKPNSEEAHTLTGLPVNTTADLAHAAEKIRTIGAQNVVISLGKTGALLHTAQATWLAHSPSISEKNPIGAGDSMVGGLVWGLTRGLSLKDALAWGIASGAATASLSGTEVGPRPLIEDLLKQTNCELLAKAG
ncbi:MAG: 1-phosphofructokinase [Anaerolineaceae bacterium]|nr:1-phosphofructokinase [Anaerolineaceae bacterium]